jgi:hypothetical protein
LDGDYKEGSLTRFYDCCKPSCSWAENASKGGATGVAAVCKFDGKTPHPDGAGSKNGCENGVDVQNAGYACTDMNPRIDPADPNVSYVYAASPRECGKCYEFVFDGDQKDKPPGLGDKTLTVRKGVNAPLVGKKLILQVINTGAEGEYGPNHFDIMMGGGGVGFNNACKNQFPDVPSWGEVWGGFNKDQKASCETLPPGQKEGCLWRYEWANGFENPSGKFKQIKCPEVLTAKSGFFNNTGV